MTFFSVMAVASIANIVKSSLGPVGLDKMLVDDIGVSFQFSSKFPLFLRSFALSRVCFYFTLAQHSASFFNRMLL